MFMQCFLLRRCSGIPLHGRSSRWQVPPGYFFYFLRGFVSFKSVLVRDFFEELAPSFVRFLFLSVSLSSLASGKLAKARMRSGGYLSTSRGKNELDGQVLREHGGFVVRSSVFFSTRGFSPRRFRVRFVRT